MYLSKIWQNKTLFFVFLYKISDFEHALIAGNYIIFITDSLKYTNRKWRLIFTSTNLILSTLNFATLRLLWNLNVHGILVCLISSGNSITILDELISNPSLSASFILCRWPLNANIQSNVITIWTCFNDVCREKTRYEMEIKVHVGQLQDHLFHIFYIEI